jgi:PAS domain-containing protein
MIEPNLRQRYPKPLRISDYALAVLSVAVAIIAAELTTRLLHAEAIALLMLCGVIFAAWLGGFGPAVLAIILAVFAFHYYLVPPINSFAWKHNLFAVDVSELPRLALFSIISLFVAFMISAQGKATEALRRSGDDLQAAIKDQKRIEAALLHSEMYLTEAQKLSRTGSFGWNVSTGEIFWSDETFRIFQCDRAAKPTLEFIFQRTHPEDRAGVQETVRQASSYGEGFDHEYRLLMPDGSVRIGDLIGPGKDTSSAPKRGRLRRRDSYRSCGPALQGLFHHQVWRHGHGARNLPFDRRGPRRTFVGLPQ